MVVPNVLAARYASAELAQIWSPEHKIVLERQLWIAVLEAQRDLGIAVPDGVVEAYRDVVEKVDLESIAARERVTRHDVKARIEEFSALAGHEHIHKGMTSRDLTENVEQLQVKQSLALVRDRAVAALHFISKEQALGEFRTQFPSDSHLLEGLGQNPLPASFVVTLAPPFRSPDAVRRWAERTSVLAGVEKVDYNQDWIDALATIIRSIEDRLFSPLPGETIVLPGHGDETTLAAERPHLQEWVDRGW